MLSRYLLHRGYFPFKIGEFSVNLRKMTLFQFRNCHTTLSSTKHIIFWYHTILRNRILYTASILLDVFNERRGYRKMVKKNKKNVTSVTLLSKPKVIHEKKVPSILYHEISYNN